MQHNLTINITRCVGCGCCMHECHSMSLKLLMESVLFLMRRSCAATDAGTVLPSAPLML